MGGRGGGWTALLTPGCPVPRACEQAAGGSRGPMCRPAATTSAATTETPARVVSGSLVLGTCCFRESCPYPTPPPVSSTYYLKSDYDVWYPLEFDDTTGAILPLRPIEWFVLDLP